MLRQAEGSGMETHYKAVLGLERADDLWMVRTNDGDYRAKAVIVTSGADYNRLQVPGEERLTGRGVSYCATCDAPFFAGQEVAVVGGGDSALDEGMFAARHVAKVYLVHRRDELRASRILQERVFADPKFEFVWNTVITEVLGEEQVTGVRSARAAERRGASAAGIWGVRLHRSPSQHGYLTRPGEGRTRAAASW
jgi:thioredoxin reductase (NADPH)